MMADEQLKVARAALRRVVDTDGSDMPRPARRLAAKALAFTEEALAEGYGSRQATDARAIRHLLERLERLTQATAGDTHPMTWVKLDRYVEMSGDTVDSVQSRRKAGKWLDGEQCKIVDGRLWINLPAAQRWVENWEANAASLATGK